LTGRVRQQILLFNNLVNKNFKQSCQAEFMSQISKEQVSEKAIYFIIMKNDYLIYNRNELQAMGGLGRY
jgi:hypothetical protein